MTDYLPLFSLKCRGSGHSYSGLFTLISLIVSKLCQIARLLTIWQNTCAVSGRDIYGVIVLSTLSCNIWCSIVKMIMFWCYNLSFPTPTFLPVLLQRGADPNIRNTDGKTALDLADPSAKSVLTGEFFSYIDTLHVPVCILSTRVKTSVLWHADQSCHSHTQNLWNSISLDFCWPRIAWTNENLCPKCFRGH